MNLLNRYASVMIDGNGGISAQGIDTVLEWNGIKNKQAESQKMLVYLATALSVKSKEREKNGRHQTSVQSKGRGISNNSESYF